jgi:hypothetical protein
MVARPPDLEDLVLIPSTPEACGFGCIAHKYLLQHQDVRIGGSASFDHGIDAIFHIGSSKPRADGRILSCPHTDSQRPATKIILTQ